MAFLGMELHSHDIIPGYHGWKFISVLRRSDENIPVLPAVVVGVDEIEAHWRRYVLEEEMIFNRLDLVPSDMRHPQSGGGGGKYWLN